MVKQAGAAAAILDDAGRGVLAALLADFRARGLDADALRDGYEGVSLQSLRKAHLDRGLFPVDFDLAMKALEDGKLVGTGPMVPFENDPNSGVIIIGLFSEREYAHLTERGYRAAQQAQSAARPTPRASVHISGGTFHNSPVGIGDGITQTMSVNVENDAEVVKYLLQLLARSRATVDEGAQRDVEKLVSATKRGDLATAKPIFERLFGEATDGVRQVGWGVVSAIAAKFLGF